MKLSLILSILIASISFAEAKTLTVLTWNASTQPGINARIVGRYMQKYMPEITEVELRAIPGAGGIALANYVYNVAEKDGRTIAAVPRTVPLRSMLGEPNAQFDPKKFTWLGSAADGRRDVNVLVSNIPYKEGLIVGDNNSGDSSLIDFVNRTTNLKLNKISGYKDQPAIRLSYERNEVDAFFNSFSGHKYNSVRGQIVLQYGSGLKRNPELINVPTLMELANDADSRYLISILELSNVLTRPFLAPPDVPSEQADKLRLAFVKAVNDPEYVREAEKIGIDASLVDSNLAQDIMDQLSKVDRELLNKLIN